MDSFQILYYELIKNKELSEDMVDGLINKIIINESECNWYLKISHNTIDNDDQRIKIAELVITKDDAIRY